MIWKIRVVNNHNLMTAIFHKIFKYFCLRHKITIVQTYLFTLPTVVFLSLSLNQHLIG